MLRVQPTIALASYRSHSASGRLSPDHPSLEDRSDPNPIDPRATPRGLIEAFEEVLDLRQHLLIPHCLGRLVDVHHHCPLEVGDGAGSAFRR